MLYNLELKNKIIWDMLYNLELKNKVSKQIKYFHSLTFTNTRL
jgi:hypothetical protein